MVGEAVINLFAVIGLIVVLLLALAGAIAIITVIEHRNNLKAILPPSREDLDMGGKS